MPSALRSPNRFFAFTTNSPVRALSANDRKAHAFLARFNQDRLKPGRPAPGWRASDRLEARARSLEGRVLERERLAVSERASRAPRDADGFAAWFEGLRRIGPGQGDPLFEWLETRANVREMAWFIGQEIAGEAGFDDLAALTQIKMPARAKLEIARNYWDEMGRGREAGMHGPLLARLAEELGLESGATEGVVEESLALANVLIGLAANRRYAFHAVGALGAIELTAPDRARQVFLGLERIGMSSRAQRYYRLHSTLDLKHSEAWNREVIWPLTDRDPSVAPLIAEGALMRLSAGARCYERYRLELWGPGR